MSLLKYWTVENFMSIAKAKCEFDETNIINIKGYNDSGKSAMLRALDVLFYNIKPKAQVNFIKDDCDYFRVVAYFDDGVTIMRDKYINGQSLYEMYKDDQLLYTTKVNGVLSRVTKVPDVIEEYLGLLSYDDILLNSRSCFEKQFLVQTSGSENHGVLNSVLKSEELAVAGSLLNNDKNALNAEISGIDSQISTYKELYAKGKDFTDELVSGLELLDEGIDYAEQRQGLLNKMKRTSAEMSSIPVYGEVESVDLTRLNSILGLLGIQRKQSEINVSCEVPNVDTAKLRSLRGIIGIKSDCEKLGVSSCEVPVIDMSRLSLLRGVRDLTASVSKDVHPEVPVVDGSRFKMLSGVLKSYKAWQKMKEGMDAIESEVSEVMSELDSVVKQSGSRFVKCSNCGSYTEVIE